MIQYSLKCAYDHSFDSWFASADAYDKLAENGMVSCAVCGSTKVSKAIMAPRVRTTKGKEAPSAPTLPTEKIRSRTGHGRNAGAGGTKFRIRRDEFRHRGTFDAFGGRPRTRHLWRGKTRRGQIPDRRWDTRHPPTLYADAQIELTSSCVNCAQHTKFAPVALVLL